MPLVSRIKKVGCVPSIFCSPLPSLCVTVRERFCNEKLLAAGGSSLGVLIYFYRVAMMVGDCLLLTSKKELQPSCNTFYSVSFI